MDINSVAVFCIALGGAVVLTRAPLIFAPRATLRATRTRLFSTNARVRGWGVVMAVFAAGLLLVPFGEGLLPWVLRGLGWVVAAMTLVAWVAPGAFGGIANGWLAFFEDAVDETALRFLGALGTVFGIGLIYLGIGWL